ncbi:bifunctional glutamate N-acetyltransferase/amino-acid acetyltransferase ArgJ [bacterium]|nr:bifunctional glutamate N-acetyltransferase/amino-acid acetyltransferase ArgJ [bacterium]
MTSLLAPKTYAAMPVIPGCDLHVAAAGIKYKNRTDMLVMRFEKPAAVAGVFTQSLCPAAPVELCRAHLASGQGAHALVVNSGNANAFSGQVGMDAATQVVKAVAYKLGCNPQQVFASSTGVIGVPLPAQPMVDAIPNLTPATWEDAARAIMTTDAFPKYATRQASIGGRPVTLNGIAKGAGMIAPDMATMLAYLVTDASLPQAVLQALLEDAVGVSFNAVTVDGDTSTNDTLMLFATGASPAGQGVTNAADPALAEFRAVLTSLCQELSQMLVRDGEGATKLVSITVEEAESDAAARRIAMSIANSPLVKTALAGCDPNWGRIVMAVGKAGEKALRDRLWIRFGDIRVAEKGLVSPAYREEQGAGYFKRDDLAVTVGVGVGKGRFTVWTCDMGHEYVRINADYRS